MLNVQVVVAEKEGHKFGGRFSKFGKDLGFMLGPDVGWGIMGVGD